MKLLSVEETLAFIVEAHKGQVRKGSGIPYACHPVDVLNLVTKWGVKGDDTRKATLCHDVCEDCPQVSYEDLTQAIGTFAALIVKDLTFILDPASHLGKAAQKEAYMSSFAEKGVDALLIKLADRICNTSDFLASDRKYAAKYWEKASDLLKTFKARKEDIVDTFGVNTYHEAISDVEDMKRRFKQG